MISLQIANSTEWLMVDILGSKMGDQGNFLFKIKTYLADTFFHEMEFICD